jgi:hypothetical protein
MGLRLLRVCRPAGLQAQRLCLIDDVGTSETVLRSECLHASAGSLHIRG